jgi:putative ABC transport system ATP-binding protein
MSTKAVENSTQEVVKLDDVYKIYQMGSQEVRALDGVSISFKRGSFWAIMGPSGSGKSTMMNILGCLDHLTKGRYYLESQDVSTLDDDALSEFRLRHIGFIFQSFNLIPQLTVQKNIELPLYYLGWDADKSAERAMELAEMVGLEDRLSHNPTELSGGQMQRVAIARALANDPQLLLADEPTGNLDTKTGEQILQIITELNEQGKTIMMVTHEPYIADRAKYQLHMLDGKIEKIDGDPDEAK